jgi:hypothetical protein
MPWSRARIALAAAVVAALVLTAASGCPAAQRKALYEADALTIGVDRAAREIRGTLVADSIYWHMCWGDAEAHVKIRHLKPGNDKLLGEDPYTDWDGNWKVRFRAPAVKGKRVYAEVPGFGNCASIRSRTVTAP